MILTDRNFETEVLGSETPVLVEFWGSWCPPCQVEKKVLKRLEEEYMEMIKIATLNIDKNPQVAIKYNIKGVPTYIVFQGRAVIHRDIAAKSEKQLRGMIEEALGRLITRSTFFEGSPE